MDFQNFEKERTRLKDTVLINSNLRVVVATEAPEATSTPRPQSPTGLANEQYSDSSQWVQSSVLEFVQKCHGNLGARLTNVGFIWLLVDLG